MSVLDLRNSIHADRCIGNNTFRWLQNFNKDFEWVNIIAHEARCTTHPETGEKRYKCKFQEVPRPDCDAIVIQPGMLRCFWCGHRMATQTEAISMLRRCFHVWDIPSQLDCLYQLEGLRILAADRRHIKTYTKPWNDWSEIARQATTTAFN